jgi:hypothetical protein
MATPLNPSEPIEQFLSLGLLLIQASVDFAGNMPDERPAEEVMNDIRRLRTMTGALLSALEQAERRGILPTVPSAAARAALAAPDMRVSSDQRKPN